MDNGHQRSWIPSHLIEDRLPYSMTSHWFGVGVFCSIPQGIIHQGIQTLLEIQRSWILNSLIANPFSLPRVDNPVWHFVFGNFSQHVTAQDIQSRLPIFGVISSDKSLVFNVMTLLSLQGDGYLQSLALSITHSHLNFCPLKRKMTRTGR
jgi:hypothetical protein